MTLADRLSLLATAIGLDVKILRTNSSTMAINTATRLIQTQRIIASLVANPTSP